MSKVFGRNSGEREPVCNLLHLRLLIKKRGTNFTFLVTVAELVGQGRTLIRGGPFSDGENECNAVFVSVAVVVIGACDLWQNPGRQRADPQH